eukprot:178629_1
MRVSFHGLCSVYRDGRIFTENRFIISVEHMTTVTSQGSHTLKARSPSKEEAQKTDPLQRVPTDDFTCQLNVVSSTVSNLANEQIGADVHRIIAKDYETSHEVSSDLEHVNDSDIIRMVKQCDEQWFNETNAQMISDVLLRIFRDNITSPALLVPYIQLPNTLKECSVDHIQYIAMCVVETVNKMSKRMTMNAQHVTQLISAEYMDGQHMSNTSILDFIAKARTYNIAAGKSRQLCQGIKQYKFITNEYTSHPYNAQKPHDPNTNHSSQEDEKKSELDTNAETNTTVLDWKGITQIGDCQNAHIVHIVDEYVLHDLNRPQLNAHRTKIIECIKTKAFDGMQLKAMHKNAFGKIMWQYCEDQKVNAWSTRLHSAILKFDLSQIPKPKQHLQQTSSALNWDSVSVLSDCTCEHIAYIADKHIFDGLAFKQKKLNDLLHENRNKIIECIQTNQINGKQLQSNALKRKAFVEMCCGYCHNMQLKSACLKLYSALVRFDVPSVACAQRPPVDDHSSEPYHIDEIRDCNAKEFVYLVEHYIVSFIDNQTLNKYKTQIVSYFKQRNLDGAHVLQIERKAFVDALSAFCGDKKVRGAGIKLHNALRGHKIKPDISSVPIPPGLKVNVQSHEDTVFAFLQQYSAEQMISLLCNRIWFPAIKAYITQNNIDGKTFLQMDRSKLSADVALYAHQN